MPDTIPASVTGAGLGSGRMSFTFLRAWTPTEGAGGSLVKDKGRGGSLNVDAVVFHY